jgi:hypothetical protein
MLDVIRELEPPVVLLFKRRPVMAKAPGSSFTIGERVTPHVRPVDVCRRAGGHALSVCLPPEWSP